jgi:carboxypeptidase Q
MKKIIYPITVAASLLSCAQMVTATPPPPPQYTVEELREGALQDDVTAYEIIEGLTTEIGPRQAGTAAEANARKWC